jgi:YgiT-type zinc finger domain-containing protein
MQSCSICKIGELTSGKVTVTLERNGSIVLLKNVDAQVCNNCSSYFLTSEMTRNVLQKAENSVKNGAELEVIQMQPT